MCFRQLFPLMALVIACNAGQLRAAEDTIDFNRDIRPILSDKCFYCHGPDEGERQGGGESGLRLHVQEGILEDLGGYAAVVPGAPDRSALIKRIESQDAEEVMPPPEHRKKLSAAERQKLRKWVEQGAEWSDHWAYIVPQKTPVPQVQRADWPVNYFDAFVLSRLKTVGLEPSPEADRATLLRRLSFDLIGLPPTPAQMERFERDQSAHAYEAEVDRLLASEHFGERMAMYWLDLVRYADSVGYHGDQSVSVSPYRDYVIQAFNSNMPFDRFTREQLAGDLLPEPSRDQLIASGYNKLGMMSAEGGVQPKEYLAKYAADRVRTAATVWLGSTLGCAECHDHKFDPFQTKDFYRFAAFFADIKERGLYAGTHADGNWGPTVSVPDPELPQLLAPVDERLAELQRVLDTTTPELSAAQEAWEATALEQEQSWVLVQPVEATALHETTLTVADDGSVLAGGKSAVSNTYTITAELTIEDVTGIKVEVLPHESLPRQGPGRAGNGNFVLTELRLHRQPDESESAQVELTNASATVEQTLAGEATPYKKWNAASAIDEDVKGKEWGWAVLPDVGVAQHLVAHTAVPQGSVGETIRIELDQQHGKQHTIGRFRLYLTRSSSPLQAGGKSLPDEIVQILRTTVDERTQAQLAVLAAHYRSISPLLEDVRKELEKKKAERDKVVKNHTRTSLITVSVDPREMRVLPRGNWMDDSGEVVRPGVPHFLQQIQKDDRATRLDLAHWLTDRANPLTARVFVNRLVKMYFGTGLSKVLDDVGSQGEWPTHPQLLDNLAVDFVESGWNVKSTVKLLVMSRTYRQASAMRPELEQADPYNRFFARQSRFRLDAELIRDNLLAVSGLLVKDVGGDSAKPYQPSGLYRHLNFPRRVYKHDEGAQQYRRGVYTHWQRQFLHPAMKAFDAPSREECTAERMRSNTPLGALVMLNDPTAVEAARVFGARALRDYSGDPQACIQWMMRTSLARQANEAEQEVLMKLLEVVREHYRNHSDDAEELCRTGLSPHAEDLDLPELAAWTHVARAIFNMHEFVTRN